MKFVLITFILFIFSHSLFGSEMITIPSGVYKPLFTAKDSLTKIPVQKFQVDIYPVTHSEFLKFVKSYPRWSRSRAKALFVDRDYLKKWKSDFDLGNVNPQSPVTHVSWFAAKAFCKAQKKRLPTVSEWEYIASASAKKRYATDDKKFNEKILHWYSQPTMSPLPSVGTKYPKNIYGVADLHGVIWEWNLDFNTALVTGESRGDSDLDKKLFCGSGSVGASDFKDYAAFMRYGFRSSLKANYTISSLGFRCAKGELK